MESRLFRIKLPNNFTFSPTIYFRYTLRTNLFWLDGNMKDDDEKFYTVLSILMYMVVYTVHSIKDTNTHDAKQEAKEAAKYLRDYMKELL